MRTLRRSPAPAGDGGPDAPAGAPGRRLPAALQHRFERSLGADLSTVRLHTDDAAARSAESLDARAFATGNDIHFGAGQYQPDTQEGLFLIAHEVAHTVQQQGGTPQAQCARAAPSGDAAEVEADQAAAAMLGGHAFAVGAVARGVQRDPAPDTRPIDQARAAANKSMTDADWGAVGQRLDALGDADLNGYVTKKMSLGERAHTRAASMGVGLERVVRLIAEADGEAARISEIYRAYTVAVEAQSWKRIADLLNGMSDGDIKRRIGRLTWHEKMKVQEAAGTNPRIDKAIEETEVLRVKACHDAYEAGLKAEDWRRAANQLHAMSADDRKERLAKVDARWKIQRIKEVASPLVAAACDVELANPERPPDPVPMAEPLIEPPDFSDDKRTRQQAVDAGGEWGSSPQVKDYMERLARAYEARPMSAKGTAADHTATWALTEAQKKWATALPDKLMPSSFARFAKLFCADSREWLLYKLDGGMGINPQLKKEDPRFANKEAELEPMVKPTAGQTAPVRPIMNRFMEAYSASDVYFTNYKTHGGGVLEGQGYCLDIHLNGDPTDPQTGFYRREICLKVIDQIAAAAATAKGDWRLAYNDYNVALVVAQKYGANRIAYVGSGNHNFHSGLNLHIHMDLLPLDGAPASVGAAGVVNPATERH
jgi:hypothetical protein